MKMERRKEWQKIGQIIITSQQTPYSPMHMKSKAKRDYYSMKIIKFFQLELLCT